jgi:GWxTD domain-containing protein
MSIGNKTRILIAAGVVFTSVLALAPRGFGAIPKKDTWYTQHYIIMQDFERKAYRKLSEEGRKAFRELFWASRTSDARAAFAARMEYVKKTFWQENKKQPWNNDRARIYLLNGNPVSIDVDQNNNWGSVGMPGDLRQATDRSNEDVAANRAEIWTYNYDRYFIQYVFVYRQANQWKIMQVQGSGSRYLGDLENFNRTVTFGVVDPEQYQKDLDSLARK